MTSEELLEVLRAAAGAVRGALDALDDWGPAGVDATHAGQYHSDVAADAAAVAVLDSAGLGVLSEESGLHHGDRAVVVVLDPVDGSTNASRRLPWYATSLCAVGAGCLDAYVDFSFSAHGPWDYLGGMLVCQEAGATMADAWGRDLLCRGHGDRRVPVAAATPALLDALVALRTEQAPG